MKLIPRILAEMRALLILFWERIIELFYILNKGYTHKIWYETYCDIELRGCFDFVNKTRQALQLLKKTPYFYMIQQHLNVIQESHRPSRREKATLKPTRFKLVCIIGCAMWNESPVFYASIIAHEAYHGYLYVIAKSESYFKIALPSAWAGTAAERQCCIFQLKVLKHLKADSALCSFISEQIDNLPGFYKEHGFARWL